MRDEGARELMPALDDSVTVALAPAVESLAGGALGVKASGSVICRVSAAQRLSSRRQADRDRRSNLHRQPCASRSTHSESQVSESYLDACRSGGLSLD